MPTPFNELELSIYEHLLLIRIKFTGVYKETVRQKPRYQFLCKFNLVDSSPKNFKNMLLVTKGICIYVTNAVVLFVSGYL